MSKRKTEQSAGSKKKSKLTLDSLNGQLEAEIAALKPMGDSNGRSRAVRPAGAESFSDDEDDMAPPIGKIFLKANQSIDKILKAKGEQDRRKKNVQQMQADAVSDHEEDDQNAAQMAAAAQAQAQALQADDGDPEPEVLQQVLFPRQAAGVQDSTAVAGAEGLLEGCREQLQALAPSALDNPDLPGSLLVNGCLQRYILMSGQPCSAALVHSLFQLLPNSKGLKVATAAFKALTALLGDTHSWEALTGCNTRLPSESPLYQQPAKLPELEAVPTEKHFLEALQALGMQQKAAAAKGKAPSTVPTLASESNVTKGTMYRLQLILRTFDATCRYQHKLATGYFESSGLQELLLTFLSLRLDPAGQMLAIELHTAIEHAVDAFDDRDWSRVFSGLSGRIAAVGPTHRAHLAALKLLPSNSPRGFALQQAAAAALLQTLLKAQGARGGATSSTRRSADAALLPEEVIAECAWFQGGAAAIARQCLKDKGKPAYSLWEVETCIKAADLLLWPHIKRAKETGADGLEPVFRAKWQQFIQALSRALTNSHNVAAHNLKLHIAVMFAWDNQMTELG